EVIHVDVTGAAGEANHDDGPRRFPRVTLGLQAEDVRQGQAAQAEGPDAKEVATTDVVTKPMFAAPKRQHSGVSSTMMKPSSPEERQRMDRFRLQLSSLTSRRSSHNHFLAGRSCIVRGQTSSVVSHRRTRQPCFKPLPR